MTTDRRLTAQLILAILVAASLLCSLSFPIAGRQVRPEHLAAPVVFALFVLSQRLRKETAIRLDVFSALVVAWVLVNAVSSWLYAPEVAESFVHVARFALLAAIFLTVANLPPLGAEPWSGRVRVWFVLGLVELAYGVAIWIGARYGGVWLPGAALELAIEGVSIRGTQFERNLFGILAGTLLPVAVYLLLAQRAQGRAMVASKRLLVAACALAASAVVLSLTRSAWIAVATAGPLAYLVFDRRRLARADRPLLQTIVAAPLLVGAFIGVLHLLPSRPIDGAARRAFRTADGVTTFVPSSRLAGGPTGIADRLATFGSLGTDFTLNTRVQDARWALDDWRASPWLGRGTGSFAQLHGVRVGTEAWLSNLVLHTMVDTGLVGLAIQVSLFVLVARRAWRAAQVTVDPGLAAGLKALTLGFLVMVLAYQITDGTWLAVFWIHLALMVNGIYSVREESQRRR